MRKKAVKSPQRGFTLSELLIVVAIIILVLMLILINLQKQVARGRDARRKADLNKIQKAYEEYYNDRECYPNGGIIDTCNSSSLEPYLKRVPCDPLTSTPYLYVVGTPTPCYGYRLCTKLEDLTDPDIARIGCHPTQGCGWGEGYNYCVSAGLDVVRPGWLPTSGASGAGGGTPTPTTTPEPGEWACTPGGACNKYANPVGAGCPITFADSQCQYQGINQCDNPANRCTQY